MEVIAQLASPIAPFFAEKLFVDLNAVTGHLKSDSVHLTDFPESHEEFIDKQLEERMELAQRISSMVLSLRKRTNIRVRQPLNKILIPMMNNRFAENVEAVKNLILSEVNVKALEFMKDDKILMKKIKPNFKTLGPKYGKLMKSINTALTALSNEEIGQFEAAGSLNINIEGQEVEVLITDVEILTEDIPGWLVSSAGNLTVALDITITDELKYEGIARELVNRIQNLRKDNQFEVTDKITVKIEKNLDLEKAVAMNYDYICSETLAGSLNLVDQINHNNKTRIELTEELNTNITVEKLKG